MAKAQVSFFVLVAVVFFIAIALFFILQHPFASFDFDDPSKAIDTASLQESITTCLSHASYNAIQKIAQQTGHQHLPKARLTMATVYAPLVLNHTALLYLNVSTVQKNLEEEIKKNVVMCLGDLSSFTAIGINATRFPLTLETKILPNLVYVSLSMPTKITSGKYTSQLSTFSVQLQTSFGADYDLLGQMLASQAKDPGWIDLNGWYATGLDIQLVPVNSHSLIIAATAPYGLQVLKTTSRQFNPIQHQLFLLRGRFHGFGLGVLLLLLWFL
ncbi:MAG: hypothetical protein QW594_01175 [Candidatus Woesearchaeota archaeon]